MSEAAGFRGSFSGYERDRLFYNPNETPGRFVQSAYVFGLDDDHDGRTAVPVDVDGDGDLDLALLTLRGLKLYENTMPTRHFARVRLEAAAGSALGAIVSLTSGGVTRRDFVKVTEGFRGQVPSDLHFGLGSEAAIERLEVTWPSGHREHWEDLPVDMLLAVREGDAAVGSRPVPRWPEGTRPTLTGRPSPTTVATRLEGGSAPIGGTRPTVVNFWAPWCAPCNVELPQLVALARRHDGQVDFAGLSVELDDLESVRATIEEFEIPYPQFLADDAVMERFFGDAETAALPSTFVFDGEQRLRRVFRGAITERDLNALLESFRKEGESEPKLRLLAETYFGAGDYERAVEYYERLTALTPDRLGRMGMAWQRRREADHARLVESWLRLAGDRGANGETAGARAAYEAVLEIDPENADATQALSEIGP